MSLQERPFCPGGAPHLYSSCKSGRWGRGVGGGQLVTLRSPVYSPNGHARFKTGSTYLLCEFQLPRAETSVPQVQRLCSSSPPHQSEKRILQRGSNIPLYIFKARSDHGADRGSLGEGIAPACHSVSVSADLLSPLKAETVAACVCFLCVFFLVRINPLQFPINAKTFAGCVHKVFGKFCVFLG